ncbi:MAG: hypothetical protein HKO89_08410 [Saprospiraceae bacterium]|nr:hypothetical protein [Saprospiraceae bacterium]
MLKKLVRYMIIILIVFLVLAITFMALSPKNMYFKTSTSVDAPPHLVYNMVNNLEKWELWSPVNELDPEVTHSFSDNPVGPGAKWTWKGNDKVGEGTREIVASSEGESVRTRIEFNGWDKESFGQWTFVPDGKKTRVSWAFEGGDTAFPFRPFNVLMKRGYRKTYEKGLNTLKDLVEKRANEKIYNGFKIEELVATEKHYLMNRQEVKLENIQQFYAQNLGSLFMKAQKAKLDVDGMPSGLFWNMDDNASTIDMAAGIPLKEESNIAGAQMLTIPERAIRQINYYGDYSGIAKAHQSMKDYLKDYNLFVDYPVIEEYVTDPGQEKDPSKWQTKISYYISENQ